MQKNKKVAAFVFNGVDVILILLFIIFLLGGFYFYHQERVLEGSSPTPKVIKKVVARNPRFEDCLSSGKYKEKVNNFSQQAQTAGVVSTPTSVVYDLKTGRKFVEVGAQSYAKVKADLEKFIQGKSISLPKGEKMNLSKIVKPDPSKDHWYGSKNARYVIIEYSDFECPFCRRFHSVPKKLLKDFGDKLAWVYRHVPLNSIHPNSQMEAEASECATEIGGNQGFWKYANKLFEETKSNGRSFSKEDLIEMANKLGLK